MSDVFPLLASLDPHHQRLGYLAALALVSTRDYASRETITSRLREMLFRKVYRDDPLFTELLEAAPLDRKDKLISVAAENSMNPDASPASILAAPDRQHPWLTLNTFWLNDSRMPSNVGELTEAKAYRVVDLARTLGVLLPGYDLSEIGFLLKHLVEEVRDITLTKTFNPLVPTLRPSLPALYLRLILAADVLFPFLLDELVRRQDRGVPFLTRGNDGLLVTAVDALLEQIGEVVYPEDVGAIQNINAFRKAVAGNASTQENYLRPRLEMLVDLGVLGRTTNELAGKGRFAWRVIESTRKLNVRLSRLLEPAKHRGDFFDACFFDAAAGVFLTVPRPVVSTDEMLLYFVRALRQVKREFGFTPGRTAALLACLLAFEEGRLIEIVQVFDAVYSAAKSDDGRFLHFSGGSRFDREFLIKADDEFEVVLASRCRRSAQ